MMRTFHIASFAVALALCWTAQVSTTAEDSTERGVVTLPGLLECLKGPTHVYVDSPEDAQCGRQNLDGVWWFVPEPAWTVDLSDYATLQNNCPGVVQGFCRERGE